MSIFLFKFYSAKMHSKKSFSRFFCNLRVPIPNGQTLVKHFKLELIVKIERDVVYRDPIKNLIP